MSDLDFAIRIAGVVYGAAFLAVILVAVGFGYWLAI